MNIILGIFLIATGAFAASSFAVPFAYIKGWKWETYWMVYSIGAYMVFPLAGCLLLAPGSIQVILETEPRILLTVFLLGAIYGIGNLSFGLALRYLGLSLGYALSLGLMLAIGTLVPPMIDGRLKPMIGMQAGNLLLAGILVAAIGTVFSAWAGILKDKEVIDSKKWETVSEFNVTKGILASLLVGITGSAMALGFEQGMPISRIAESHNISSLFAMLPLYVVLLSGTLITTLAWCLTVGARNRSLKDYIRVVTRGVLTQNYLWGLLAGFLWFSQFIMFSMGKSKMGPYTFTSWGILMALIIAFAAIWGFIRKEWKGASKKVYVLMAVSIAVLIAGAYLIGLSSAE
jgi:L-rhamnose-H+ transport protein